MLHLDDVHVIHHPGTAAAVRALRGVHLRADAGEFLTIIGANGSGKSSVIGVVAGTVAPVRGSVRIDGIDVTGRPDHRRARWVARVFDDPRAGSAPQLDVEDNLALAMARGRRRGLRRAVTTSRREQMRDALAVLGLGLEDRLSQPVGLLSAGQRQSLTMVMATLAHPSVLLLDEHLAALDPTTAGRVLDLTRRLAAEAGSTTIMVTHDMDVALATGDRLLVMHRGEIAADLTDTDRRDLTAADLVALLHDPAGFGGVVDR